MKKIEFLGGDYYITEFGELFTKRKGKLYKFKPGTNQKGYKQARLVNKDGKQHSHFISRLVYQTFVDFIPSNMQIDHIDNDKTNNHVSNLRIVTNKQNQQYRWNNFRKNPPNSMCIFCNQPFLRINKLQKYCSSYCSKRHWRLEFKNRTGSW